MSWQYRNLERRPHWGSMGWRFFVEKVTRNQRSDYESIKRRRHSRRETS